MISSFVLELTPLKFGEKIIKFSLYKYIFKFLINNGVSNDELKTITVSNFFTRDNEILSGKTYSFKIASINSQVAIKIIKIFFYNQFKKNNIKIFNTNFQIKNIYRNIKYSQIFNLDNFFYFPLKNEVTIKFLSPTFFKIGDSYKILKEPSLFFKTLLTKFRKSSLSKEIIFSKELNLEHIKLKEKNFKLIKISEYKTQGFTGEFTFYIEDTKNVEMILFINILSYFSIFSGVGYACEKGYGQTILN